MRKRLLIAAAFSLVAMACGYFYIQGIQAQTTGGRKVSILVAASEIPAGSRLTKEQLGTREIPEAYVHPDAITAGPNEEARIVGRPVVSKVSQGQPLLWSSFDAQHAGVQKLSAAVPRHRRAVTVPVDLSGGFAGMLRAGDHVDIVGSFSKEAGGMQTFTILQNIVVLATGDVRGGSDSDPVGSSRSFNSVTLSVDLDEAEMLAFAGQRGSLSFALRGDGDFELETDITDKNWQDIVDPRKRQAEYRRSTGGGPPQNAGGLPSGGVQ